MGQAGDGCQNDHQTGENVSQPRIAREKPHPTTDASTCGTAEPGPACQGGNLRGIVYGTGKKFLQQEPFACRAVHVVQIDDVGSPNRKRNPNQCPT